MNITLRLGTESEYREIENLVREAFWDIYKPGCDEHLILHKLRTAPSFIRELHMLACTEKKIIGNIVYSKAYVKNNADEQFEVLCMGPIVCVAGISKKRCRKFIA